MKNKMANKIAINLIFLLIYFLLFVYGWIYKYLLANAYSPNIIEISRVLFTLYFIHWLKSFIINDFYEYYYMDYTK